VRQRLRRHRQAAELADLRIVAVRVLVDAAAPVADEADLRARRRDAGEREDENGQNRATHIRSRTGR
jgi:hypothetical protein